MQRKAAWIFYSGVSLKARKKFMDEMRRLFRIKRI